jgi:hypothetical protein
MAYLRGDEQARPVQIVHPFLLFVETWITPRKNDVEGRGQLEDFAALREVRAFLQDDSERVLVVPNLRRVLKCVLIPQPILPKLVEALR